MPPAVGAAKIGPELRIIIVVASIANDHLEKAVVAESIHSRTGIDFHVHRHAGECRAVQAGKNIARVSAFIVPAERLVAYIVAGLFALLLVGAVGILALVGIFRLVDVYMPSGSWATWLVFGGVFTIFGVLLLSIRK